MPFTHYNLPLVKLALEDTGGGRLATFSLPDLIMPLREVRDILDVPDMQPAVRPDSAAIVAWHKAAAVMRGDPVYDTADCFRLAGVALTAFDIHPGRGGEIPCDLSLPVPEFHHGEYDVLFDCISNQCFDVAQALRNALALVRDGGYIVHCIPARMLNQGFYDISPTLFPDFYHANGAEVLSQRLVVGVYRHGGEVHVSHRRMRQVPEDAMNLVVVRKSKTVPYAPPVMGKFREFPDCKIEST